MKRVKHTQTKLRSLKNFQTRDSVSLAKFASRENAEHKILVCHGMKLKMDIGSLNV